MRNLSRDAGGRERARPAAAAARQDAQVAGIARMQIERGAVGICCAKLGEAEVFADAGHRRHPPALSAQSRQRRPRVRARRPHRDLVHRRRSGGRARLVRRVAGARGRPLDVLVKVDVGFHRCGIDPRARPRSAPCARLRRCRGCASAGCSAMPGHGYGAHSENELRGDRRARRARAAARPRRRVGGRRATRSASARRRRAGSRWTRTG